MSKEQAMAEAKAQYGEMQEKVFDFLYESGRNDGIVEVSNGNMPTPTPPAEGGVDVTPFAQADIDRAVEEATAPLKQKISELELSQDQKDQMEEAIADQLSALQTSIRNLTQPKVAPPADSPAGEETQG